MRYIFTILSGTLISPTFYSFLTRILFSGKCPLFPVYLSSNQSFFSLKKTDCFWNTNLVQLRRTNDSITMSRAFDNWLSPFNFPCQPWSPPISFRSFLCSPTAIVFLEALRGNRSRLLSNWRALKDQHRNCKAMHPSKTLNPVINACIVLNWTTINII